MESRLSYFSLLWFPVLTLLDQSIKWAAYHFLQFGNPIVVVDILGVDLSWELVLNRGMAWGIAKGFPNLLIFFRFIVLLSLLLLPLAYRKKCITNRALLDLEPTFAQGAWILILTGGVSNFIDLFFYGYVVDMISVTLWSWPYPVFNVADIYITIAAMWLLLSIQRPYFFKKANR